MLWKDVSFRYLKKSLGSIVLISLFPNRSISIHEKHLFPDKDSNVPFIHRNKIKTRKRYTINSAKPNPRDGVVNVVDFGSTMWRHASSSSFADYFYRFITVFVSFIIRMSGMSLLRLVSLLFPPTY